MLAPGGRSSTSALHPCFVGPHSRFVTARTAPELFTRLPADPAVRPSAPGARARASGRLVGTHRICRSPSFLQAFVGAGLAARPLRGAERRATIPTSSHWPGTAVSVALALGRAARGRGARLPRRPSRRARPARRRCPDELHPRVREALAAHGIDELYAHQRRRPGTRPRAASTSSSRPGRRQRQDARLQPARARRARARAEDARALPLSDEGARAGPGCARSTELGCPSVRAAIYDGDTPSEQRWQIRKWANLILTNPDMLHIGVLPHHDRWGDVLSNLALRRHRRGARLPRRLRLARRQRAAAAAPAGAGLRRRAAVPARLGDDRQPGRARRRAARRRGDGGRRRRRAARRADDRALEPAAARRGARACARARSATRRG